MFELKQAGPDDYLTLANIWVETFQQAYGGVHTQANIDAYCADNFSEAKASAVLSTPSAQCMFSYSEGKVSGFYILQDVPCPASLTGKSVELKQIYILQTAYGSGLGKYLFDDACASAKSFDAVWMWLAVSDINHRAQSFYRKLDFMRVGVGPQLIVGTDRLNSSLLAKTLS